jgi:UDP-N-acetylmuramoyl-tripeptide--D-alanyl-D-alanine ligase
MPMGAQLSKNLWSAQDIAQATDGKITIDFDCNGVEIDSRAIGANDLFIALKVDRDGHDFVPMAFDKGASGALVSRADCVVGNHGLVICDDTMLGLENLGAYARRRAQITTRLAVTGSVGKTTVKELTAAALAASGKTHKSVKSYNNHWGVPLTLARLPQDARFGVFEIGMNHAGEISRLSPQVRPHIAAITTVAPVHIEHFGTIEAIADAKAEIFLGIEHGGHAIIPADNSQYKRLFKRAKDIDGINIISFGIADFADAKILSVKNDGKIRHIIADILGEKVEWQITEPGEHWINNGLCALTMVSLAGGELEAAASVLSSFGALEGRGAVKKITFAQGGEFTLVDEAYNANPTSVGGALHALAAREGGRKIAVLGDMLELGEKENEFHAGLIEPILAAKPDLVFLAGTRMKHLWDIIPEALRGGYAANSKELAPKVCDAILPNDVIMVKGSNGSHMNVIVGALGALKHTDL